MTTAKKVLVRSAEAAPKTLASAIRSFHSMLPKIRRLIQGDQYQRLCDELASAQDLLASGHIADAEARFLGARGAAFNQSVEYHSAVATKAAAKSAEVRAVQVNSKSRRPAAAKFSFGFAMLRDDLTALAGFIEAGNEIQAEILSERLITDLRRAGSASPTYEVHLPTARMYNDVAVYIHTCLVNINRGRPDLAAVSVRDAHKRFRASPWYPKDESPSTPPSKSE